ncbi:MAG: hypothetical protein HGA62_02460 [Chlorobiaceae bacterium]|nr:hypothetical protein [Chlorobiaceae bacterium]NTV60783.1 hypothetical protein [Chlorobiaceae bacterium]
MNVHHIVIDDKNPEHLALSICRTGRINRVRLDDSSCRTFGTIEIGAHDYAALFHYGITEALNRLPFISETGNGLDSWDEAFLHNSSLPAMQEITATIASSIKPEAKERILLGWQDQPVGVAYLRDIDPVKFLSFLAALGEFVRESAAEGYDLEFLL